MNKEQDKRRNLHLFVCSAAHLPIFQSTSPPPLSRLSHTLQCKTMSSPESHGPAIFQTFKTKDKKLPPTISTQVCTDTGKRYVLWSSIQEKFVGINYLQDWNDVIVLFMINYDGQLYVQFSCKPETFVWFLCYF